jgi:hypothetical protein
VDHQPPDDTDDNAGQNGRQGDPVPPVRHHFPNGARRLPFRADWLRPLARDSPLFGASV